MFPFLTGLYINSVQCFSGFFPINSTLPEKTNSLPLKIDAWKMIHFLLGQKVYFHWQTVTLPGTNISPIPFPALLSPWFSGGSYVFTFPGFGRPSGRIYPTNHPRITNLNSQVTNPLEAFPQQLPAALHAVAPRVSLPLRRLDVQITWRSWSPGGFFEEGYLQGNP